MASLASLKYHGFLTHDWGIDTQGRPNHERVTSIHQRLKAMGLNNWFDEERMHGNVQLQMCNGIDESAIVVVFVTKRYLEKVGSGRCVRTEMIVRRHIESCLVRRWVAFLCCSK